MTSWAAIVVATAEAEGAPMQSRLPAFLHPVAGRPLVWHTVSSLISAPHPPSQLFVVTGPEIPEDLFDDLSFPIIFIHAAAAADASTRQSALPDRVLLVDAAALIRPAAITLLLDSENGAWVRGPAGEVVAGVAVSAHLGELLLMEKPLAGANTVFPAGREVDFAPLALKVTNRCDLAIAHARIRDRIVQALMDGGVTFIHPESVVIDVGVRIGSDSVVYPGAVIEGQTTIGEETVIGPSCRIIDSWIGSGVELRGWNYVANTSIRNRAILEPYVRRGFE